MSNNVKVPGKAFKLSKTSKRMLAQYPKGEARSELKRSMIQAELFAAVVPKREKKEGAADVKA